LPAARTCEQFAYDTSAGTDVVVLAFGLVLWVDLANGATWLTVASGAFTVTVFAGSGGWVIVAVGPGTVCCTVTVVVGPATVAVTVGLVIEGAALEDAPSPPPIAARTTRNAMPPATQPATSFTGGSAPYRPLGPRERRPRPFSQKLQPGGAGGQLGSGCQPGGGCQSGVGGAGQPGGELNVAMVSSPLGGYIQSP